MTILLRLAALLAGGMGLYASRRSSEPSDDDTWATAARVCWGILLVLLVVIGINALSGDNADVRVAGGLNATVSTKLAAAVADSLPPNSRVVVISEYKEDNDSPVKQARLDALRSVLGENDIEVTAVVPPPNIQGPRRENDNKLQTAYKELLPEYCSVDGWVSFRDIAPILIECCPRDNPPAIFVVGEANRNNLQLVANGNVERLLTAKPEKRVRVVKQDSTDSADQIEDRYVTIDREEAKKRVQKRQPRPGHNIY